jgi:DNA-binding NarL/FixJ family response regulator
VSEPAEAIGSSEPTRIRVVLVEDHAAVRAVVRMALETADDMEVVGEAADGEAALRVCGATHPDVVLMDLRLPRLDGVAAIPALLQQDPVPKVLVLTADADERHLKDTLAAGASGYVLKMARIEELLAAVRATRDGRTPTTRDGKGANSTSP